MMMPAYPYMMPYYPYYMHFLSYMHQCGHPSGMPVVCYPPQPPCSPRTKKPAPSNNAF
jgi:hypothetical protein